MNASWMAEGVRIALESLRANKLRTFLTLLGNIVGVMSVIAVVSLLDGIDLYAREKVLEEGSGVFTIQRVNPLQFVTDVDAFIDSFYNPKLSLQDVAYLRDRVPSAVAVGARLSAAAAVSRGDEQLQNITVRGYSVDYPLLEDLHLADGRHLATLDIRRSKSHCVLGWEIAEELFGPDVDPIGRRVRIAGRAFQVVGVFAERGAVLGSSRDRFVAIPVTTWQKIFDPRQSVDIRIKAADVTRVEDAIDEATVALRIRHRLRPSEDDDFAIVTSEILLGLWNNIEKYISLSLIHI